MFDVQENNDAVVIGDGTSVKVQKVGSLKLTDCRGNKVLLKNAAYVPQFHKNIISITKLTNPETTITFNEQTMMLNQGNHSINFDKKGNLYFLAARREKVMENHDIMEATNQNKTIDINKAHDIFGHVGENALRKVLEAAGMKPTGKLLPCEACI